MISIFRYVSGYVEFCADGGFPERFLNLCKLNGISLWNVENDGVKVKACTSAREFKSIKKPAENSGMTVKILENKGIPFWAKRHKWRCGLLVGLLVAVCLVWYMSGFIWEVEITKENGVKINNFTETLAELGVKPGIRKSQIDIPEVQEALLDIYPELSWVSINIFGDKARVEYTPSTPAPEIVDTKTPSNIVALKSGKIVLIEGYDGTNAVKEGAFVSEGSLLISGVKTNGDGSEKLTRARGKVFAETENLYDCEKAYENDLKISDEIKVRYKLNLFGLKIPLGFKPQGEKISQTDVFLTVNSVNLPVGIIRDESLTFSESTQKYSLQEINMLNLLSCVKEKRASYKEANIKKATYKVREDEQGAGLTMSIICVENIASEQPVYIEEN